MASTGSDKFSIVDVQSHEAAQPLADDTAKSDPSAAEWPMLKQVMPEMVDMDLVSHLTSRTTTHTQCLSTETSF